MILLNVSYLTDAEITKAADQFRRQNNANEIPIDIERLIESNYNIDIIPVPGLQRFIETEGCSSSDFSCIYVDDYNYSNQPNRYRFTLAHEIGHLFLHKKYFDDFNFHDYDTWKKFVNDLDQKDHDKMEYQAYAFAGNVLVPTNCLKVQFENYIEKLLPLIVQARRGGLKKTAYIEYAIENIANSLSKEFEVSIDVMKRRIAKEKLEVLIP